MPEDEEVETTTADEATEEESTEEEVESQGEPEQDADSGLKKALAAERKARRDAEKRAKAAETQLADKDRAPEEQAIEAARREAREEAMTAANARIIRSEVKAAAAGKIKNPALALKLIDASEIEVGDDGEVDSDAIEDAIATLLEEYPELAADGRKFTGGADQGAKGKSSKPSQMTQAEFDQIKGDFRAVKKAKDEGLLNELLGIKS